MDTAVPPAPVQRCEHACSDCDQRAMCLPAALDEEERGRVGLALVQQQRTVARGDALYRLGHRCTALYAVWSACFKTSLPGSDGTEQVAGFVLRAELLGLDGLSSGLLRTDAAALKDSRVCVVPWVAL